jgi:hypothetical protein
LQFGGKSFSGNGSQWHDNGESVERSLQRYTRKLTGTAENASVEVPYFRQITIIYPYARIVNELKTRQTDMTIMFKY